MKYNRIWQNKLICICRQISEILVVFKTKIIFFYMHDKTADGYQGVN